MSELIFSISHLQAVGAVICCMVIYEGEQRMTCFIWLVFQKILKAECNPRSKHTENDGSGV